MDTRARLAGLTVGIVVVALVASALLPHVAPLGVLVQGAELGSVTGLLALGLVLTYRANRIINFSYGAMGGVAGTFAVMLDIGHHVNWFVCLVLGLVAGAVVGAVVEMLVIRRFFNTPRLILTVATIGLAQILGGIQILIPGWLHGPALLGGFRTPLTGAHFSLHPVLFTGDDLLVAAVVPVVLAGLGWFLLRTDAGRAVRATADNSDRALLLGIPIRRLSTLVWIVAGVLSALTVMVNGPSQGLTLTAAAGPALLLPALAAAVVARFESLPRAFLAGVGLGIINSLTEFNISKESVSDVVFFAVILVALLLQRRAAGRSQDSEGSWQATGILKPIPAALRRLPEVALPRYGLGLVVAVVLFVVPFLFGPGTVNEFTVAVVYGIVVVSLVVLSGWAGNISLGQFAFAGIGGVVAGDLISKWNVDLFLSLTAAGIGGAVVALIIGVPALRIRGFYLAVTTLALAVALNSFFLNPTNFNSLLPGSIEQPVLWKRFDLSHVNDLYWFCLGALALFLVFVAGLRAARGGRVFFATRDNERAAAAMAVPPVRVKLAAFVLSGAVAGVAGGLHSSVLGGVGFDTYDPSLSILLFSMAVIGGLGSISGSLMGVALIEVASHAFPTYSEVIGGAGLLIVLLFYPGGLGQAAQSLRDRFLRAVADRRGILVPSLVADRREEADTGEVRPAARDTEELPVPATVGTGAVPLLRCEGVEISYGPVQVLFGVDLEVAEGEMVALLGTNGAGKSTLLKGATGLVGVGRGRVHLDGTEITNKAADSIAHLGISLMPGGRGIFPTLTVDENLRLAGWLLRRDKPALAAARAEAEALFPILSDRSAQAAGNLSGGEQQMLSLAMALMTRPRLLMIDELSLGLAPTIVGQLMDVVRARHAEGTTILLVEQSVNVSLELAERAVFLEKGEVRFSGAAAELLDRPDILRSVFIAGGAPPPSARRTRASAKAAANGAGRRAAPGPDAPTVLECRGVTKRFGGIAAVGGVDLTLRDGEILGLIGHNGAGKTTLFDLVSGFLEVDGGRVLLGGVDISEWRAYERAAAGLGRSFQEARLFPSLTVAETLAVALERHLESRDLVAAGLRLPASLDSEWRMWRRVDELVEMMGLGSYREKLLAELSTGTRRIVELACILAQDPAVVLLDEPSAGVAQRETEALGPLLMKVQEEAGCSILIIEHDMPLLTSTCDRMVALELGAVIAEGTPAEVLAHPRVIESYLGTDQAAINRSGARGAPGARAKPAARTGSGSRAGAGR